MERACPKTKGIPSCAQRSASQVPGEDTLDGDDQLLTIGGDSLKECFWTGLHVAVEHNLTVRVEATDRYGPGM
jgi:hypothetical protein